MFPFDDDSSVSFPLDLWFDTASSMVGFPEENGDIEDFENLHILGILIIVPCLLKIEDKGWYLSSTITILRSSIIYRFIEY